MENNKCIKLCIIILIINIDYIIYLFNFILKKLYLLFKFILLLLLKMVVYTIITSGEDSIPVDGEIIDYLKQYINHLSCLLEDNPETLEIFL